MEYVELAVDFVLHIDRYLAETAAVWKTGSKRM